MMNKKSSAGGVAVLASTLFLLALFSLPASAAFTDYPSADYFTGSCTDNQTAHFIASIKNTDCNRTECSETWNYDLNCTRGCSNTLGACRPDAFWEGIYSIILILFVGAMIYVSPKFGPVGVALALAVFLFVMYVVAAWDVFSDGPKWFMLTALPIATIVYLAFHFYAAKPQDVPASDMGDAE